MSWLNINQSLNSLKGQISNFASEVLLEAPIQNSGDSVDGAGSQSKELEEICRNQELEITSLKKQNEELQASLQSERLGGKNGVKEEESSWYWDPPPQPKPLDEDKENQYQLQIRLLQQEISSLKERDTVEVRMNDDEELNRLREENKNLTSNLEDLDNQHQLAMERLLSLKQELQKNFEVLKDEHEDLKSTNDEYSSEIKVLQSKLGERDKEIENVKLLKSDFETLQHKHQNLERIYSLLRENAEKFQEENQDLHEEIFKLQEQVTKLEHDVEISTKNSELSNTVSRKDYEDLLKELNDLKSRRKPDSSDLDEVNIDDNAKSVIENLKRDISELRHKLNQRETNDQDYSEHKNVKSEKIMYLYNKYVNFELPIDYVGEIPSSDDGIVLFKLESVFKTLNSFKKEIDVLEQKLSEKVLSVNHLQTQIDDLTTENDFLTTDLQHFERELNEMKKNNDFLISEIAALKNTSKLEPIIETHEDNIVRLENELADSNRINKTFESEIKRIERELLEVTVEKKTLQESLNDLKQKYTTMFSELEICKNQTKAVEELEHNATAMFAERLNKTTDEIDDLKKRLNLANAKNEQLSIDIHILENDKVLLTKEVDDLKHMSEKTLTELKDLEALKVSLEHKLQGIERKFDESVKYKTDIEREKVQLEESISNLGNELKTMNNNSTYITEIEKLTTEKVQLSQKAEEIALENSTLKETVDKLNCDNLKLRALLTDNNKTGSETTTGLQRVIEELKLKLANQDELDKELLQLKEDNNKLYERKRELETELTSTDDKILKLEGEFDKLIADLNEKDTIIDALNGTIAKNEIALSNLRQNISDLENSLRVKNEEISKLGVSVADISEKLNISSQNENQLREKYNVLLQDKESINSQIVSLSEERKVEISAVKNRIQEMEKIDNDNKNAIQLKENVITELNQSVVELKDKIKQIENVSHNGIEHAKLVAEKEALHNLNIDLKNNLTIKTEELSILKTKCDELEKICEEYKKGADNIAIEKSELINFINLKHNESLQYHSEIQRLNNILLEQANEFKKIVAEKDNMLQNHVSNCSDCEKYKATLKEKDEIIIRLNQSQVDLEKSGAELLRQNEVIKSLTERCETLDKKIVQQLENVKKLTADNVQLSEKEQNAARELERLRRHLVETEENYTQELMTSEQKLTECQTRLHQVEERAKQNSTVYTSNSIRANQEVETLRNQIKLLEKQREDVQTRLSDAEDGRSRSEAALINLQVVLEQFQLDKERDIHTATEKIRNKLEDMKRENSRLQEEVVRLNLKLEESLAGLQAASRLGDQVETKTAQINDLKEQVRALQATVAAAEERYHKTISNQQDKVDKNLVKNLVINYVLAAAHNNHNRSQVLRLLSTVLDFNQQECEKLGLVRGNPTESLAAEFVKFLQQESKPRTPLPGMMTLGQNSTRSTTPVSRKNSGLGPQPNPYDVNHKRNPSSGSSNPLFQNIDAIETTSQISFESDTPKAVSVDTGVNQLRNTEGAILKHVLKDM